MLTLKTMISLIFLIILVFVLVTHADNSPPLIEISSGFLQGHFQTSYNGKKFSAFEGIPFAKPPVSDLRFEAPEEPYNWTGRWIADTKHTCIQCYNGITGFGVSGEEDCLYLNVYVPKEKPTINDNMDVIVHIHGGAFMLGSGHIYAGPEYIMDEDVIFVTSNYRLGVFGFLSTEDEILPGNNGLKDQAQALKWIQKNIKYFGGNPDSVTITGLSAGGASVHFHYLSPLSRGLFQKGVSQSGTALSPWALQEAALDKAKGLATLVGCASTTSKKILDCLKTRPAYTIAEATIQFFVYGGFPFSPFAPVVEKAYEGAFLSEHPFQMLVKGKVADIPWITSVTENEGIYPGGYFAARLKELDEDFEKIIPHLVDYNYTISTKDKSSVTNKIREYYFKDSVNLHDLITLLGDRHFKASAGVAAQLQARANKSPVYFYILAYRGERSFSEIFSGDKDDIGVSHGDDIFYYLFYNALTDKGLSKSDEEMKTLYMQWLLNFAKIEKPQIENINWSPVEDDKTLPFLYIKGPQDMYMTSNEDLGAHAFWSKLPLKENGNSDAIKDEL